MDADDLVITLKKSPGESSRRTERRKAGRVGRGRRPRRHVRRMRREMAMR